MAIFVLSSSSGMRPRFSRMVLVAVATIPEIQAMSKIKGTIKSKSSYQIGRPYDWCQLRKHRQLVVVGEPCTLWVPQIQCRIDWALHVAIESPSWLRTWSQSKSWGTSLVMLYIQHLLQDDEGQTRRESIKDVPVPSINELDVGVNISSATTATSNDSDRYEMNWFFSLR